MINQALLFTVDQLNLYLKNLLHLREEKVSLTGMSAADGGTAPGIDDKLSCSLVNIQEEATLKNMNPPKLKGTTAGMMRPPVHLNLYLLFAGHFANYSESLKFISHTVKFFQSNPVFNQAQYPSLDSNISMLVFELVSMDFQELNLVWGMLGNRYQPSVIYKMRMLTIASDEAYIETPLIQSIHTGVNT